MAQIGLVCLGIFILIITLIKTPIALTSAIWNLLNLYSQESDGCIRKIYSDSVQKCKVSMKNEAGLVVCTGEIAE
jgi:3-hydroxyacyl-[acyl-carrier-protein] dehydratase